MTSNTGLLIDTFAISRWYNKPHIAEAAVVEHKLAYFFDDWSCCLPVFLSIFDKRHGSRE